MVLWLLSACAGPIPPQGPPRTGSRAPQSAGQPSRGPTAAPAAADLPLAADLPPASREDEKLRGTAFVIIATHGLTRINQAVLEEQERLVKLLKDDFHTLHPQVRLELDLFREEQMTRVVARRTRDGLGPDLMLVSGSSARSLMADGLSRPVRLNAKLRQRLPPQLLSRLAWDRDHLVGIPMLLEPQLACFNRQRLSRSPGSLVELERLSEQGIDVGLPIDPFDIYWTVGALGANTALARASRGQPLSAAQRQQLLAWLRWLRSANLRERINFFSSQEDLLQGLLSGRLDWISCRSGNLERLQRHLGKALGVGLLPSGPGGPPTPLIRQRVWVLGRSSSPNQQRIAEAFARFSLSPIMQTFLTLHTEAMLPVNREVQPPIGTSPVLQAMVASERQSWLEESAGPDMRSEDPRLERLRRLVLQLVFAEITPEQTLRQLLIVMENSHE